MKKTQPTLRIRRKQLGKPCSSCWGKGYSTHAGMYKTKYVAYPRVMVIICPCPAGDQLKKHFSLKKQFKP